MNPARWSRSGRTSGCLHLQRRMVGERDRDLHDPRRCVHPRLQALRGRPRDADGAGPGRAPSGRRLGRDDGAGARGDHLGQPRRAGGWRRVDLRRDDPPDPRAGPRLLGRGAGPRPAGERAGAGDDSRERALSPGWSGGLSTRPSERAVPWCGWKNSIFSPCSGSRPHTTPESSSGRNFASSRSSTIGRRGPLREPDRRTRSASPVREVRAPGLEARPYVICR
jgi:hypothetical protein